MLRQEDYTMRKMESSDLETVLKWRNSDRIRASMYTDRRITWEEHLAWFQGIQDSPKYDCRIFEYRNRQVGVVNFTDIDRRHNNCSWGFYLGETDIPRGSGSIMGFLGLTHAFETAGIRKLCGEVLLFNDTSIQFHKRLGFKQEGHLTKHIFKNGSYEDVLIFAMFAEDWPSRKMSLEEMVFRERGLLSNNERNPHRR